MIELAQQFGEGPVQSRDIAERQDVPEPYLNQLLTLLRKAGLIVSRRGPGGGHVLAHPASEINLAEIVTALEGSLWPVEDEGNAGRPSQRSSCFALREVWQEMTRESERILRSHSLADLVERERRRAFSYQI